MFKNWDSKENTPVKNTEPMHPACSVGGRGHAERDQGPGRDGKWQQRWEENAQITSSAGQGPAGCSSSAAAVRYDETFGSISQLGNTETR